MFCFPKTIYCKYHNQFSCGIQSILKIQCLNSEKVVCLTVPAVFLYILCGNLSESEGAICASGHSYKNSYPQTQQAFSIAHTNTPCPQRIVGLTTCHFTSLCRDEWDTNKNLLQTTQMERQIGPLTWMQMFITTQVS